MQLFISVKREGSEIEKWPFRGYILVKVPDEDFEATMWQV
jgi:biotin operon repressor